ncbi:hypothetical protein LIN78_16870 [Leeia sp. TBRC 13508]|uniref:Uncharacterized protein n=1 Tax=Leeia speluncae TaxID=2884804 RepID=A0ABS8DAJ0_9NEIS|nr:hypothetical protein [Leeia speluncae]MCB6185221.1 hypothetical protein [Leeia speluncae]
MLAHEFKAIHSSISDVQSHPMPVAIHRLTNNCHLKCNLLGTQRQYCFGLVSKPHSYRLTSSDQLKAGHLTTLGNGRQNLANLTRASGHGVIAQHTPQPLQGAPAAGFIGEF